MRKRLLAGLGLLALTSSSADAQTPKIDHQPVGCAVADRFPRLEARFAPGDAVAVARVLFQPENAQQWYAVAMKAEGAVFSGVLPKPKKSLKAFRYYIEVSDKSLGTNRTADYTTNVVGSTGECKGMLNAASLGSASVLLQLPAGTAALPAGFASTGVVAAGSGSAAAATAASAGGGGGLSTSAVVGIVGGVGALGAAAAVVASRADGGTGSETTAQVVNSSGGTLHQVNVGNVVFDATGICDGGCSSGFVAVAEGANSIVVHQTATSPAVSVGSLGPFSIGAYRVNIRRLGGYCAELWRTMDTGLIFNSDTTRVLIGTTCSGG